QLKSIKFLRPIKSQANYILCEVINKDSAEVVSALCNRFNIIAKDCSNKKGFENKNYIRLAVRNSSENQYLIDSLKEI
ncbi:hypothetical protein, partial [Proteus mirabilis]